MPFTTSTNVSSLDSFLSDFVTYCVANAGFTDIGNTAIGGDTLYRMSRTRDSLTTYWGFRNQVETSTSQSNITARCRLMHLSPDASNFDDGTSGSEHHTRMGVFDFAGPYTRYYFFTDVDSVFGVLEVRPGIYTHIAVGNMSKIGTWNGGEYLTANNFQRATGIWRAPDSSTGPNIFTARTNLPANGTIGISYFRVDNAGSVNDFQGMGTNTNGRAGSGNMAPSNLTGLSAQDISVNFGHSLIQLATPNTFNLRSPIMPVFLFRESATVATRVHTYGQVPNIGYLNMQNISPAALIDGNWRIIPLGQKTGDNTQATVSGIYGVAYREIP